MAAWLARSAVRARLGKSALRNRSHHDQIHLPVETLAAKLRYKFSWLRFYQGCLIVLLVFGIESFFFLLFKFHSLANTISVSCDNAAGNMIPDSIPICQRLNETIIASEPVVISLHKKSFEDF